MASEFCPELLAAMRKFPSDEPRELWHWIDNPRRCQCEQCSDYADQWTRASDEFIAEMGSMATVVRRYIGGNR